MGDELLLDPWKRLVSSECHSCMLCSKGGVEDDVFNLDNPLRDSSTSLFHSKRMPFLSAKSKIPGRAVALAYTLTFLMTKSGMGYGVNPCFV